MIGTFEFQAGPGRKPWAHQLEFFDWGKERLLVNLWMGMGTGKTALTLNLIEYHRSMARIQGAIIVVPARYADTWVEEIRRCFPGRTVINILRRDDDREANAQERIQNSCRQADYYIVNYESLGYMEMEEKRRIFHLSELGISLATRLSKTPMAVVADESTHIKNHRTARSKGLYKFRDLAKVRICLSGTPLPQGPQDAFGQYAFTDPNIFGYKFTVFRNHYLVMGGYKGKEVVGLRPDKEQEFNEKFYSIAKRITKEECMDLPPKVYQTLTYDLKPHTRRVYDEMAKDWVVKMGDREFAVKTGLTKSLRMAQICTGFLGHREMSPDGEAQTVELDLGSKEKIDCLMDLIEDVPGKVIVWCKWMKNIQDISKALDKRGILYVDYYSRTLNHRANEMAFRENPKVKVFLGTGESGGMGLNLQGPEVGTVVYFSQGYSALIREQSEDRAHRGDIKHTVTVIDMVAKGTVEEAISTALRDKIDLQRWILQNPEAFMRGRVNAEAGPLQSQLVHS